MGCCCSCFVSKEGGNCGDGSDRRNECCDVHGSSHGEHNLGDTGPLLQDADSAVKDHGYKTFNGHQDQSSREVIEDLLKQQSEDNDEKQKLVDEKIILEEEIEKLKQELLQERKLAKETGTALEEARKKSVEDTRAMSHIMELKNKGGHEAANNPFSPSKLGARLKTVYEDQGLPLLEYFDDEVEGAKFVSNWLKSCYDLCKKKADSQVTKFCFLDGMEVPNIAEADEEWTRRQIGKMLNEDEFEYIYYLRWKTATSKEAIDRIKQEVSDTFSFQDQKYSHIYNNETKAAAVKSFVQMCAEICWLIATCQPALHLQFDVVNLIYELRIKNAFSVFATQKKVQSLGSRPGVIVAVVCPALLTADDSIIMQGEVIRTDLSGGEAIEEERSEFKTESICKD